LPKSRFIRLSGQEKAIQKIENLMSDAGAPSLEAKKKLQRR